MRPRTCDVAIAGGGPAGLAAAIEAARRGFSAVVLERRRGDLDKACGEGVLPPGVRALERLGALGRIDPGDAAPIRGIRWLDEESAVEGRFRHGPGLGVRRPALIRALALAADAEGARVVRGVAVTGFRRTAGGVAVDTAEGELRARLLVIADGLASPLRRRAGLDGLDPGGPRRYGIRRHFRRPPWSSLVEVHWADGAEAYVTPAGPDRVGVAILFDPARTGRTGFDALLARFPPLVANLEGASPDSRARGAGPLRRGARRTVDDGVVLLGDAAGYVDAITGEGISLALGAAEALGASLPDVLAAGARRASLRPFARATAAARLRYRLTTEPVLLLARRPALRRRTLSLLAAAPSLFERLLGLVAGDEPVRTAAGSDLVRA